MRKVVIIANCHSMSLARSFSLGARGVEIQFVDLNFLGRENETAVIKGLYEDLEQDTVIFSFHTSGRFSPVSTAELTPILAAQLHLFTNVRFDGLHPDLTYIGPMNGRRHGVLSVYHSKIILYAFAQGISAGDCARMFDFKAYEKLGYFDVFAHAERVLLERDQKNDVKFAASFLALVREEPTLYTFNHPNGRVFQYLTEALCNAGDIKFVPFNQQHSINELSNNCIWPVYNEIAEYHRLPYRSPQYFVNMQSFTSRTLSWREMVDASYDMYSRQNRDDLVRLISEADFYPFFVQALS